MKIILKHLFVYLERDPERGERQRACVCWSTLQVVAMALVEPEQSQELRLGLPHVFLGELGSLLTVGFSAGRKLDQSGAVGSELAPVCDVGIVGSSFTCHVTTPAP